jgi:hypothetical protein
MKYLLTVVYLVVRTFSVCAQSKTESFVISIPAGKVSNSFYKHIRLLDIRSDTTDFGIIQKGAFNRKERVVAETPFSVQFAGIVDSLTDETARNGELLFLLRELRFAEVTGAFSEKGYFHFRGSLFAKKDDLFQPVAGLDTVVVVSALDVTRILLKTGSMNLFAFIKTNLTKQPAENESFTITQLRAIDSIEKIRIPLYANAVFKDGAYKDFTSLMNQQPDNENIRIRFNKNGTWESIQLINKKGKYEEIELNNWYAFVFQNRLCIITDQGVYPVEKKNNDFYFTGKASVPATSGEVITAGIFFGLIGALAASGGTTGIFELKLDHLSGGFIRVRPAKEKDIKFFRRD